MIPYLIAYETYRAQHPATSWTQALDFHFQHGVVVSTDRLFVMARPVPESLADELHDVLTDPVDVSPIWHVWMVAGDLLELLKLAHDHGIETLTYLRHGSPRLRRARVEHLLNRSR